MDQPACRTEQLKELFTSGFISVNSSDGIDLETMISKMYLIGSRVKWCSIMKTYKRFITAAGKQRHLLPAKIRK